jgi:hypothetical protein
MKRRVGRGHPSGGCLFRAVLRDRITKELVLILPRAPATLHNDLDAVPGRIPCSLAEGTEQTGIEVGHGRNIGIEDPHAVRDGAI